jgi:serine/threonine protein kinase
LSENQCVQGVLSDGQEVAVKKLLGTTGHGLDQLHNEVLLLAELQHKNLVRLQGFCLHQEQTLLVYEYIKNGSLDNILFGNFPSQSTLQKHTDNSDF